MKSFQSRKSFYQKYKIYFALAPAVLIIVLFLGSGIIGALLGSFGYAPIYNINEFPTFKYYHRIMVGDIGRSIILTLYYASVTLVLEIILSINFALILRKIFQKSRFIHYIYKIPLVVPYIVVISLAVLIFSKGGILSRLMFSLGLIQSTSDFPNILYSHKGYGIIMVFLWKQVPFMTLSILAVLLGIEKSSEEAAKILGASRLRVFFSIVFPQILPGIVSAALICFAYNLGAFEVPYILGGGYPNTLSVIIWRLFDHANYEYRIQAMCLLVNIAIISGLIMYFSLFFYRQYEKRIGRV